MKSILFLFVGLSLPLVPLSAQYFLNGSAVQTNDSCFQLTDETNFVVGSVWDPDKIDLRNNFDLVMNIFFGNSDEGADGIAFGLQPVSASVGEPGEGLGIGGVTPAFAVEFDTYQNLNRQDPVFDHIAILSNGAVTHGGPNSLVQPIRMSANRDNVENGRFYPIRVTWDANAQRFQVYFDCDLRLEYQGDIVNEIFGGDPFVFYGFTAATGGLNNRHEVCFTFNSFLRQLEDVTMCPGGNVLLDVTGGVRYEWTPVEGLDDPVAPSVLAAPDTTTTYTVRIFDECDLPVFDTVRIAVEGDSAFVKLGPDTTICDTDFLELDVTTPTAIYAWSDPALSGPTATVSEVGSYSVTVTRQDIICEASDRITIENFPDPEFDLGPADTSICAGDSIVLRTGSTGVPALLPNGETFTTLTVKTPGRYRAELPDPCGNLFDQIDVAYSDCDAAFLPTAFSPNDDGVNDRFFVQDGGDVVSLHVFRVFNRWGQEVFFAENVPTNDPASGWNGKIDGRPAPPGVYVWTTDATYLVGRREVRRGEVNLLR